MEKQDLKNILKEGKKDEPKEEIKIRKKHKKPMQLRDIENRSSSTDRHNSKTESNEDIDRLLNKEKGDIFKQHWNRLDTGMKLNRIRLFTETEAQDKNLTKEEQETLRKLLVEACRNNKLNKNTDVEYNREDCMILKIKTLTYSDGNYHLIFNESKKSKKTTKSKSNIDRFINKKG